MNDEELFKQILASYENDCQTLTTGAESNILKWKELNACLSEEESTRYDEIKSLYNKSKLVKGDDKMGQAVVILKELSESVFKIKNVYERLKPEAPEVTDDSTENKEEKIEILEEVKND